MSTLSKSLRKLAALMGRTRFNGELEEEMAFHREKIEEELRERGMSAEEAHYAATRQFGNATRMKERSHEVMRLGAETVAQDVCFALRQMKRSPGFTLTAVLTLALGIAVNATMFSMVSAFLMPRVPGHDPDQVVVLSSVSPTDRFLPDSNMVSAPNYLAWRAQTQVFSEMAAEDPYRTASLAGQRESQAESVEYAAVSPNYFALLGAVPQQGRAFAAGDDQPGRNHIVILSNGLWQRRFHGDPAVIGSTVRLNRQDNTIVGVMGADFRMMGFTDQLWTPLTLSAADALPAARRNRNLVLFARLQPGVTLGQVRSEMDRLAQQAAHDNPDLEQKWGAAARMLPDYLVYCFGIRNGLMVMMTVVGFVLLIACANVAGLLLARAVGRQKELAVRLSLGASRIRVVRQLLTEGLVLALAGGSAGLLLSIAGIRFVEANLKFNDAIAAVPVRLDRNVLWFAVALSVASALLSSLAPAFKASRTNMNSDLKSEGRSMTGGPSQSRLRSVLVSGEIALAMALLLGGSLLIRGVYKLEHQNLGIRQDHLLTAGLVLDAARYGSPAKQLEFEQGILPRLEAIPGVMSAAVTSSLPATGASPVPLRIRGAEERPAGEQRTAQVVVVSPEYQQVAGVTLLRGRTFTQSDDAQAPRVALVNQEFVTRYLDGKDPLGRQVQVDTGDGPPVWDEIVGVVSDVKAFSDGAGVDPEVYQAFAQRPVGTLSLMLRTNVEPESLTPALRQAVAQTDTELPILRVMTMEKVIDYQRYGDDFFEQLLAALSLLALLLAAIGIYGLIAYSVGQRNQEIGIRLALGARGSDIAGMILRQGLSVAGIGAAIGLLLGLPMPRLFDAMFEGYQFGSVIVYPAVAGAMLVVVLFATWLPARRAARVDPVRALRAE